MDTEREIIIGETTARVVLDSLNESGARLTTVEVEFPTIIQAQVNTHKALSKNAASQRAIPSKRWLYEVPVFVPNMVALAQKGMGESEFLEGEELEIFRRQWLEWEAENVAKFEEIQAFWKARKGRGISKGLMNRPLGTFRYTRVVLTGVGDIRGWKNFERLRCASDAQGEHQLLANKIREEIAASTPVLRTWHLPYAPEDLPLGRRITWSCSQCARVSFRRENTDNAIVDRRIFGGLSGKGHWSTFEHQAVDPWSTCCVSNDEAESTDDLFRILENTTVPSVEWEANFYGSKWAQLRKFFDHHTSSPGAEDLFFLLNGWIEDQIK